MGGKTGVSLKETLEEARLGVADATARRGIRSIQDFIKKPEIKK